MLSMDAMRDELWDYLDVDFTPFPDEHVLIIYDLYHLFDNKNMAGLRAYLHALSALLKQGNKEIERDAFERAIEARVATNKKESIRIEDWADDDDDYLAQTGS